MENCKLNFLFISADKFPPFRVDIAVLFGQEIVSRGHTIDLILQSEKDCDISYQTIWSGCRVWVGRTDNGSSRFARLRKHIYRIENNFRMFSLIRSQRYDFIQVKDEFISAILAIIAAKLSRIKFIYWLSFPFPEASLYKVKEGTARYPIFYLVRGWVFKLVLYRLIMPLADHIFVQSEQMKTDIMAMGIDKEKLTPVPMGVSLQAIPQERVNNAFKQDKELQTVVYLGTLERVRRIDFLVRVIKKVLNNIPNIKLYLVGDGNDPADQEFIRHEAARLGIEDAVIITGFLPREEALKFVQQADVCVSPFYPTPILNSTSPTKLVEYMAMGKPTVANDHPEQRLVIEESGGGICVPYEESAFAKAILDLLADSEKAKQMGIRGRQFVQQFRSYTKIADRVENKYFMICNNKLRSSIKQGDDQGV